MPSTRVFVMTIAVMAFLIGVIGGAAGTILGLLVYLQRI